MFSLIACIGKNNELGKDNKLIFHIKDDMKFFRETTKGHKAIMGRKTWDSLPGKLKERENIVITRQNLNGPDLIIHNPQEFIVSNKNTSEEIFVIGGASIYEMFLPYAKNLYLTEVDSNVSNADAFFPKIDKTEYHESIIKKGKENDLTYSIKKYARN